MARSVIVSAVRTPFGRLGGGLKDYEATELGSIAIRAALERAGVETYDPAGEPFDPTLHEALSTRPADGDVHPGVVVDVVEKGYRLNDTILRPARVIVSQ
jgi:molecular chaperone GrpE